MKLRKESYRRIKEKALDNFKNYPISKELQEVFLPACWVDAVLSELKHTLKITDLNTISHNLNNDTFSIESLDNE